MSSSMHTPTASRSTRRSSIGGRGGATLGGAAVAGGRDSLSDDELLFASFSKSHHHQQQKQQDQPQEIAGLSLDVISNLKLVALNKRLKIRNYRTSLRQSILAGETDDMKEKVNTGEETAGASQRKKKNSIHTSDSTNMDPRIPEVIRNPILKFETENIRWQAVIEGELEKFLYPSLQLEDAYVTDKNSGSTPGMTDVNTIIPTTGHNLTWKLEKIYQNTAQSGPSNGHERLTEEEARRMRFDQKLEVAEGLLMQQQQQQQLLQESEKPLKNEWKNVSVGHISTPDLPSSSHVRHHLTPVLKESTTTCSTELLPPVRMDSMQPEKSRERRKQLLIHELKHSQDYIHHPEVLHRLEDISQNISEIQKQASDQGQIKYYSDKQHLFAKWAKLEISRHHYHVTNIEPKTKAKQQQHLQEEEEIRHQEYNALSPRSIYYQECVNQQIIPEPIYSRIKECHEPVSSQFSLPQLKDATASSSSCFLPHSSSDREQDSIFPNAKEFSTKRHESSSMAHDHQVLSKKQNLELNLQHFGLGDTKIHAFCRSFEHFKDLSVLNLSENRLTENSIIELLQALQEGRKELSLLNLSKNRIASKAACQQVASFLESCISLTTLDLSDTTLRDDIGAITLAIESHPSLKIVNLSYNHIGEDGGMLIGNMITQKSCCVTELDISWNQICRTGAVAIGNALSKNTAIRLLNLAMNRFGDEGGQQVASALQKNTTLTNVDISRNALGGASAITFSFFLRRNNQTLKKLVLSDNSLGPIGGKALMRAVAFGATCEIVGLSVHDVEAPIADKGIFDAMLPSLSSPFTLDLQNSPYHYVVACELLEAALVHKRCKLTDVRFLDTTKRGNTKPLSLLVDEDKWQLVDSIKKEVWILPPYGIFYANALYIPSPLGKIIKRAHKITKENFISLANIIKKGISSREICTLMELAFNDLYLFTFQGDFLVSLLKNCIDIVEIIGRLWACLIDGENAFSFLTRHLIPQQMRRLIDTFGTSTIQFTTKNPTGRWTLDLSDRSQRKIVLWFSMINHFEAQFRLKHHEKRTDTSQQQSDGFYSWRNVTFNRKSMVWKNDFYQFLPCSGILEFDYVSTIRYEDLTLVHANSTHGNVDNDEDFLFFFLSSSSSSSSSSVSSITTLTAEEIAQILQQIGAEVCSIYIPIHKRNDLKNQQVLFHVAMSGKHLTCSQIQYLMQFFPKNYDSCRYKAILSMHRGVLDLENLGPVLDRLIAMDRKKVYVSLGYLNVLNPLYIDNIDFEVDFQKEDEKNLLRALVDLSMAFPMDLIRIDSTKSDVLVIYSMYQSNSVLPQTGRIFFRYVSHPFSSKMELIKARMPMFKHFLTMVRLEQFAQKFFTENVTTT